MTVPELIALLEEEGVTAERKSVYADLQTLADFGLDIVKRKESGKVVYYVGARTFELPELKLLVDAVQSSRFITRKKSEELIRRLESLTSRHLAGQLQREVVVSGRIKNMNESIYYNVDRLQSAITAGRQVTFQYFDWGVDKKQHLRHGGARYTVSPWAMVWDDENYYLVAYHSEKGTLRHYRVDRMLHIAVTDLPRRGEAAFRSHDLAAYSRQTFGMFGGEEQWVTLRCHKGMAGVMLDRFGSDTPFLPDGEDHFTARVPVVVSPPFFAWLSGFEQDIRLIAPAAVAQEYVAYLTDILAGYADG